MSDPVVVKLKETIQFGTEQISELRLKPTGRSMRDFTVTTKGDGSFVFEPYAAARVGVHMAGHPNAVLDLMNPVDLMRVSAVVMGFFGDGLPTGGTDSQS